MARPRASPAVTLEPGASEITPAFFILHPSSFILHPSSFILHPSSFILHPSSFILPPSSFILPPSFFILPPSLFPFGYSSAPGSCPWYTRHWGRGGGRSVFPGLGKLLWLGLLRFAAIMRGCKASRGLKTPDSGFPDFCASKSRIGTPRALAPAGHRRGELPLLDPYSLATRRVQSFFCLVSRNRERRTHASVPEVVEG
jgi:hypothetical protein